MLSITRCKMVNESWCSVSAQGRPVDWCCPGHSVSSVSESLSSKEAENVDFHFENSLLKELRINWNLKPHGLNILYLQAWTSESLSFVTTVICRGYGTFVSRGDVGISVQGNWPDQWKICRVTQQWYLKKSFHHLIQWWGLRLTN